MAAVRVMGIGRGSAGRIGTPGFLKSQKNRLFS